jgi:hypothetical protein
VHGLPSLQSDDDVHDVGVHVMPLPVYPEGHGPHAKPVPGAGNLPVLPDTGEVDKFSSPDDARAHLKLHGERIRRERTKLREEAAQGDRPRANDW